MPRLPRVTAIEVERALSNAGFLLSRQRGAHRVWIDPNLTRTVVPFHAGKTIGPKLLKRILRQARLTVDDFIRLLNA